MAKIRRSVGNLSEHAYVCIREKILRGDFQIGAPISRRKLATQLGMSPLPISHALRLLESEDLVESRPRVGTRVRIPTPQDVRDRYILREALETQSARLFSEKASPQERLELRNMAARLDEMMERCINHNAGTDQRFRFNAYHLTFHMRIAECAGSRALSAAIEKNRLLIFNWLWDVAAQFRFPPRWHQDLMDVLADQDPEAADRAMRHHVRYNVEEIQAVITSRFGLRIEHENPLENPLRGSSRPARETGW
jgi:GntR family transcriptional regulator, rspAB operon transcriptional repressor